MSAPHSRSIASTTVLYLVAACLMLVGVEVWRELATREETVTHAREDARGIANLLAQHTTNALAGAERAAAAVSSALDRVDRANWNGRLPDFLHPPPPPGRPPQLPPLAFDRIESTNLHPEVLLLFDESGVLRAASAPGAPASAAQMVPLAFAHHAASSSPRTFFAAPVAVGPGKEPGLSLSRRIDRPDGSFGGMVVAVMPSRYFTEVFTGLDIDLARRIAILTFDGQVLAAIGAGAGPDVVTGQLTTEVIDGSAILDRQTDAPAPDPTRIEALANSLSYPLSVIVELDEGKVLSPWLAGAQLRLAITLLAVALLGFLGWRLVGQMRGRRASEAALARKDAEFRLLAEGASDVVERYSFAGERLYISPAIERLTGFTPEERRGTNAYDLLHEDDRPLLRAAARRLEAGESEQETVTFRTAHRDGREIWLESSFRRASDGETVVGVTRDVTSRKLIELQLALMASIDGLTGLSNRRAFDAAISREVESARTSGQPLALLLVDADRFKRYNDDYGHLAGDSALRAIADVLRSLARPSVDLAARYGGEEMVLLLPGIDQDGARRLGRELCRRVQALSLPHSRNMPWGVVTVSVGVGCVDATTPESLMTSEWLISSADLALYDAKSQGRNQMVARTGSFAERLAG